MGSVNCDKCNHSNDLSDKICGGCGKPLSNSNASSQVVGFVILIVIGYGLYLLFSSMGSTPEEKAEKNCNDGISAFIMSETYVTSLLKSPSTANFPSYSKSFVSYRGNCTHTINAYVDSQNSFGAIVRNNYSVKIKYDKSNDKWELINANIK